MKTKDKEKNMPTKPKLPNEPKVFPAKVRGRGMRLTLKFTPPLPAPRVMHCCAADIRETEGTPSMPLECTKKKSPYGHTTPTLLIPFPSRKAAESARKFWALTEEERVEKTAEAIFAHKNPHKSWASWKRGIVAEGCREYARACLAAMGGGTK